jgi:hypothetical protein
MNSPRCQLYLRVPDRLEPEAARGCLAAALEAGDVAALLVRRDGPEEKLVNMLEALAPLLRRATWRSSWPARRACPAPRRRWRRGDRPAGL